MTTLDLAGTFGLRVGGVDVRELRVGGQVAGRWERRVNLCPAPLGALSGVGSLTDWAYGQRWSGAGPSAATVTLVAEATDGPLPEITRYHRRVWTNTSGTNNNGVGFNLTNHGGSPSRANAIPVTPGSVFSLSVYYRRTFSAVGSFTFQAWTEDGASVAVTGVTARVEPALNGWARVIAEGVHVPPVATHLNGFWAVNPGGALAVDDVLEYTGIMYEASPTAGLFLSGDTPNTPAALHHWTATPHASTSVRTLAWQPGD